jgi:hypothetical protein
MFMFGAFPQRDVWLMFFLFEVPPQVAIATAVGGGRGVLQLIGTFGVVPFVSLLSLLFCARCYSKSMCPPILLLRDLR